MIESIENKINYQFLRINESYEILIRAEKNNNYEGLIITNISNVNILNSIIDNVKNCTYSEVIEYLKNNNISYKKVEFI